ncbi:metallophosphoesterase [Mucilaginibacter sp. AW1-3]
MEEKRSTAISRRSFVSSIGVFGAVVALQVRSFAGSTEPQKQNLPILKSGPYLQAPSANSITVRWLTNVQCFSWVEYGETFDKLDRKAESESFGLVQAFNTINAISINDLQPGKRYFYRICSKEIKIFEPYKITFGDTFTSEVFSFNTADPKAGKVSFLVFNDIHDRPESFSLLMKYNGDRKNDFVFLNGDMFNFQVDEDQLVDHLLKPFGTLFNTVPFFFSRGNHEVRGKFARNLPQYFNSEKPAFYFSFQYGPMYAIVLDSGEDKEDNNVSYEGMVDFDRYRIEQAAWLEKEIKKPAFKKAKYKIVFSHIPLYNSGDWHGTMHCRQVWGPILNKAKINLLISGHTHQYGIHLPVPGEHNYPIVIGGGPGNNIRTIIKVDVDDTAFKLEMLDDSGKRVGEITI